MCSVPSTTSSVSEQKAGVKSGDVGVSSDPRFKQWLDREKAPKRPNACSSPPASPTRPMETEAASLSVVPCAVVEGLVTTDIAAQQVICLSMRDRGPRLSRSANAPRDSSALMVNAPPPIVLSDGWTLEIDGGAPMPVAVDLGWGGSRVPSLRRHRGLSTTGRPPLPEGLVWRLVLPGVRETAELRLDGLFGGRHIAGDAWFTLPTQGVEVAIELHVRNTAANRYYQGTPYWDGIPKPSGLTAAPRLVSVAKEAHFGGGSPA